MANMLYFADKADGTTLQFSRVNYRSSKDITGFADGEWHKVNRVVERKSNPSRHECDARCYNATGLIMRCECSCGGKNHGKGAFNCTAVAA